MAAILALALLPDVSDADLEVLGTARAGNPDALCYHRSISTPLSIEKSFNIMSPIS
jgi:hypothetical protein